MKQGLLYENAKIKSRESSLFGKDKMQRLVDAPTVEEGIKILLEGGYPAGKDYLEILSAAEREAEAGLISSAVPGHGLECFSVISDYHNAKVIAKELYFGASAGLFKADGSIAPAELSERIKKDDLSSLPVFMHRAFEEFKKKSATGSLLPSYIDKSLDRAAFEDISQRLKTAHPVVKTYFETYADLTNIETAYRSLKAGLTSSAAEEGYLPCGKIPFSDLNKLFDVGFDEGAIKVISDPVYKKAAEALKEGVEIFETYRDNALLSPLKKAKYDMFSPAPIVGFYLGKMREIKNVRLIFAAVKNGVDKETLKVRLREMYV